MQELANGKGRKTEDVRKEEGNKEGMICVA